MAVVFISPQKRLRMFIVGITICLFLFLAIIAMIVFYSPPKSVTPSLVFNKPKITINTSVFDSDIFKNLKPFTEIEFQFKYKAYNKDKKLVEGFITAPSKDEAQKILTNMEYAIVELKEVVAGRDNPFTPYFEIKIPESSDSQTKTKNQ